MWELRGFGNQAAGDGIVSCVFRNVLIGDSILNANFRKSFLPDRSHEPEFSPRPKRESAF
jgi:hypothetical protein